MLGYVVGVDDIGIMIKVTGYLLKMRDTTILSFGVLRLIVDPEVNGTQYFPL